VSASYSSHQSCRRTGATLGFYAVKLTAAVNVSRQRSDATVTI
jgi:hypothetical protein